MIHIKQLTTIEDYLNRFSALLDQIAAYDSWPHPVHYITKFLDGLFPGVRILVAIQKLGDLETTYSLVLLYEELGEECGPSSPSVQPYQYSSIGPRRFSSSSSSPSPTPPPLSPARWVSRSIEEKRAAEQSKAPANDKWQNLKAYGRSKGLCFICSEKWGRDHQCKANIQLHIVHEMVECIQTREGSEEEFFDTNE